jgi:hypothetical protein
MLEKSIVENIKIEHQVVLKGQYQKPTIYYVTASTQG